MRGSLTVFLQNNLWIALAERFDDDGTHLLARVVLGAEPSGPELLALVRDHHHLFRFGPAPTLAPPAPEPHTNPKRALREAARAMASQGSTSQAQEAMRLLLEAHKRERQEVRKEQREAMDALRFAARVAKRKKKHRGH